MTKRARSHHRRGRPSPKHKLTKGYTANPAAQNQQNKYYLFWKPYGVLSQFTSPSNSEADTLSLYINEPNIYAAGRLDRDSEGLLVLTNDGLFQHKLCDPRFGHWRTYWVQVERIPSDEALEQLRTGVMIKGKMTRPAKVQRASDVPDFPPRTPPIRIRKSVETTWLTLSLQEGMNRQVRRMTAAVGHPTLRLIRSHIHLSEHIRLSIDSLRPGELRSLTDDELCGVDQLKSTQARASRRR